MIKSWMDWEPQNSIQTCECFIEFNDIDVIQLVYQALASTFGVR